MHKLSKKDDFKHLTNIIKTKKTVIVGVGNPLKHDDGIGVFLAQKLSGKVSAEVIDAGSAPENYIGKISKLNPECVIVIDAVDMGKTPGTTALLAKDEIKHTGLGTHDVSIKMFMDMVEQQTNAQVILLAIQPKSVGFGEGLSKEVEKAVQWE